MTTPTTSSASCGLPDTRDTNEATPAQVAEWLRSGTCTLVDVRERDEHARERIAGAINRPSSTLDPKAIIGEAGATQRIVMHCKGGKRAADAVRLSGQPSGVTILNLQGGIEGWKAASLPVVASSSGCGITVMRQTQLVIGLGVVTGSALAWFAHPGFIAIPAFFGLGLVFAGASGTCGLASFLGWMPWNRTCSR